MEEKKFYTIECAASKCGSYCDDVQTVFVTDSDSQAKKEFEQLRDFCNKHKDSNWSYTYTLVEWENNNTSHQIDKCENID